MQHLQRCFDNGSHNGAYFVCFGQSNTVVWFAVLRFQSDKKRSKSRIWRQFLGTLCDGAFNLKIITSFEAPLQNY